jgi:hypothetical protein
LHDVGLFLTRVGLLNSLGFGISSLLFSISIYQLGSQAMAFGIAYMGCLFTLFEIIPYVGGFIYFLYIFVLGFQSPTLFKN